MNPPRPQNWQPDGHQDRAEKRHEGTRPIIGLTTSFEDGKQVLDVRYADAVERAGGIPMILPATSDPDVAARLLELVQGLIIPGGPAITKGMEGTLPEDISETDPRRVASDQIYLRLHRLRSAPVLGICYGMQFLNAEHGGTILADAQAVTKDGLVHSSGRGGVAHPMDLESGSWLARILDTSTIEVNTYHIQAVASVGDGLRIAARAPDGVIEAIESQDGSLLGVQFHPERQVESMLPIFRHLVERARTQLKR